MPDDTAPLHQKLSSAAEYEAAINTVIGQAHNVMRIFDYNAEGSGYNSPERSRLLQDFLLASRANRLYIVLHDLDYLLSNCPRMTNLMRQFNHAVSVHQTTAQAKDIYDPFIIADNAHYVHRFHYDDPRALLALNDVAGATVLRNRFAEIWETSAPAAFTTTLGL